MGELPNYITGIFAVFLLTAFVKLLTTLSILRYGIGLRGAGFGAVVIAVAFALSLLAMNSQIQDAGGIDSLLNPAPKTTVKSLEKTYRPFLEKYTDSDVKERFVALAGDIKTGGKKKSGSKAAVQKTPFPVLISAFLISELKEAFQIGFLILIPFLVVDLLITNILLILGVTQISTAVVSLPLKILLFFAVDGWTLIAEKLLSTYI